MKDEILWRMEKERIKKYSISIIMVFRNLLIHIFLHGSLTRKIMRE